MVTCIAKRARAAVAAIAVVRAVILVLLPYTGPTPLESRV
jgi:hypothetical protein